MFLEWENNSGKFQNNAISDVKQMKKVMKKVRVNLSLKLWFDTVKMSAIQKRDKLHLTYKKSGFCLS